MRYVLALALAVFVAAPAWADHFEFGLQSSGGITNPLVLVGFNPQPEPPVPATLDLDTPSRPEITTAETDSLNFRFLLGITPPGGDDLLFDLLSADRTGFLFSAKSATGGELFRIDVDVAITGGGELNPLTLVGFNPQPEPPGTSAIGFDGSFTGGASRMSVGFQVVEVDPGATLSFAPVPGPGSLAGLALGFLLLAAGRLAGRH